VSVPVILASGSARRRDILGLLGLEFEVRPPDVDETMLLGETADETALRLAIAKVGAAAAPGELVVAADTLVLAGGAVLGKPGDEGEARRMLAMIAGGCHEVHTGLAVSLNGRVAAGVARTLVWFRPLAAGDIAAYVGTREPLDKAGSYGIQGFGAALVERIDGDFYNVMGLPVPLLIDLITRLGLEFRFGRPAEIVDPAASRDTG